MADDTNTNPFLSDEDDFLDENSVETPKLRPALHDTPEITWDSIANKLLKEKLTLTALELHTELVEAGRELPRLRDFFSNPGNFERSKEDSPTSTLPRTSSIQTFDSLDFTRYSDDGERQVDERVAVLEFELRKAQDTIKSLRASLTKEAETEHAIVETSEDTKEGLRTDETIRTMEKKALNFLVNEYLLQINNKLTAVTFSEENEDQNFEDWDDVGLNVPQPPDLLHLYRDYNNHTQPERDLTSCETQTDETVEYIDSLEVTIAELKEELATVKKNLGSKVFELEELLLHKDKEMFQRRGVAEGSESEPSPSPLTEKSLLFDDIPPIPVLPGNQTDAEEEEDLDQCKCDHTQNEKCPVCIRVQSPDVYRLDFSDDGEDQSKEQESANVSLTDSAHCDNQTAVTDSCDISNDDEKSKCDNESKQFDGVVDTSQVAEIETVKNVSDKKEVNDSLNKNVNAVVSMQDTKVDLSVKKKIVTKSKDIWKDSGESAHVGPPANNYNSNRPKTKPDTEKSRPQNSSSSMKNQASSNRKLSNSFINALKDVCFNVPTDNRIITEVSKITDTDQQKVVLMLGRCLPHIVPNVLLAKREELIPLIICTTMLHPDAKERDNLLNILFNLIKKPDEEQRQMILTGCIAFAQHVGPTRLEAELLPQCWEQISHKYMERRLLVAEACGALAQYIPSELRSSLVLSMLQQMLQDDKEADVREAVVRSLGLIIGFINDKDKYSQGSELLKVALKDTAEKVVTSAKQILLPSFAMWAYELGRLEHSLMHGFLRDLEELTSISTQRSPSGVAPLNEGRFLLYVNTLQELVPFLYLSVLESGPYTDRLSEEMSSIGDNEVFRYTRSNSRLTDLVTIVGNKWHLGALVKLFEEHVNQEWFEPWDNLNWMVNNLIPRLLDVVLGAAVSFPRVVSCLANCFLKISTTFGKVFVDKKIKPRFIDVLMMEEDHIDPKSSFTSNSTPFTTCVVPVYAKGVLSAFNTEEDRKQLSQFLREALFCLAAYQAPKDSLRIAFAELCQEANNHDLLLTVLWEGVVHSSPLVRSTAARLFDIVMHSVNESLASTRGVPALVTLGSDPDISVRVATIPALGTIIETVTARDILEKVYMQLQSFLDDPAYREEHALHLELVSTFTRVGPNAEQKFRDEFMLPRLTALALENNNQTNEVKKREMALQLFEAYSALSCCFINYQLVQEALLPGLRCLKQDMASIAPEHEEVINSMLKGYESKIETSRPADRSSSFTGSFAPTSEDMKARLMSKIKESTTKANISSLFNRKK